MFKNLYLVALAAVCGLSACQRQQIGGFQRTHTESFARAVPVTGASSTAVAQPAEDVAVVAQPVENQTKVAAPAQPEAQPVLVASAADQLVAASKGTKYEARALRMKAAVEKAEASGKLSAAPRKLNFAEKAVTKLVTKKLNKKIAKAERGESTQALDKNLRLAIIFAVAAIVLSLIPGVWWLGSIAGVVALVFFILWIVDQAG
jgi:hypothetical protein